MANYPITKAYLRINKQSFSEKCIIGEVSASDFEWEFKWSFAIGELTIEPSLGRALIQDALLRFLIKADYKLEQGGDYIFTIRSQF